MCMKLHEYDYNKGRITLGQLLYVVSWDYEIVLYDLSHNSVEHFMLLPATKVREIPEKFYEREVFSCFVWDEETLHITLE